MLAAFPNIEKQYPVFCYGDTIYNPFDQTITPDIEHHESIHSRQQGDYPEVWYERYINEPSFRLEQEIEAYGSQYAFLKYILKDISQGAKIIEWKKEKMAEALSSPLYGSLLPYAVAESKIRSYGKHVKL